jgi:hypothetical protein
MALNILPSFGIPEIPSLAGITEAGNVFSATVSRLTALIRPDNPPPGIAGFLFHIIDSQSVTMSSKITDNTVSAGLVVQDHIEPQPETVTIKGYVAEIFDAPPSDVMGYVEPYMRVLDPVAAYIPQVANTARRLYNEAERIERAAAKVTEQAGSLYKFFNSKWGGTEKMQKKIKNQENQNELSESGFDPKKDSMGLRDGLQTEAFAYFRLLWSNRLLVTIETPWGVYKNMAIQSIKVTQDGTTGRFSTLFDMIFKHIRINTALTNKQSRDYGAAALETLTPAQQTAVYNKFQGATPPSLIPENNES